MPTERQTTDAYTARALLLLRVGRGLGRDTARQLRALAQKLRTLLADVDLSAVGRRDLAALLRTVDAAIDAAYTDMATAQASADQQLATTEAAWAHHTNALPRKASNAALDAAMAGLLVLGLPPARHWQRQAANVRDRVGATIRNAAATGQDTPATIAGIVGQGRRGRERGGLMERARQQAATLADTAAHEAAYAGRQAAWKAGGTKYLKWHSILDTRTTLGCAVRAGKLYTLDFQPVGHDIPIDRPPPRHWNCRSILVAMSPDFTPPGDGQDAYTESLDAWLKRQTDAAQDALLGPTRAALWRSGKINARALVGRDGETLSIADLARTLPEDAKVMLWTGEANYARLATELTPAMRKAGEAYGLAEYHMVALRHYTEDGYEALNASLRGGRVGRATVAADVLNEALDRLPTMAGESVRRTALDASALAEHQIGALVNYSSFTSASRRASDVMRRKPHRLIITGESGRDVAQWSAFPWQEETLFRVNSRFRVLDRKDIGDEVWIWLKEIDR